MKLRIILFLLALGFHFCAAQEAAKPTIKVGIYYTGSAETEFNSRSVSKTLQELIAEQKSQLTNVLINSSNLNNDYQVTYTNTSEFLNYTEPKNRSRKTGDPGDDEYVTYSFEGTHLILDEIINHKLLEDQYIAEQVSTFDNVLNSDFIDYDELDLQFNALNPVIAPDIIILIVDEKGDPIVSDDRLLQSTLSGFDESLYAVVSLDELEINQLALSQALFGIFCDEYESSLNELPNDKGSLLSYLETYDVGNTAAQLSNANITYFKANVSQLKLSSESSKTITGTIDNINGVANIDAVEYTLLEPVGSDGYSMIRTDNNIGDNSSLILSAGLYSTEAPGFTIPARSSNIAAQKVQNRGEAVNATAAALTLPIKASSLTSNQWKADIGLTTSIAKPSGSSITGMEVVKKKDRGFHAKVRVGGSSGISNLAFGTGEKKLALRVYSPAANVEVRLQLEDHYNTHRAVAKAFTKSANQWEWLIFDFDPLKKASTNAFDANVDYQYASIYFNFCKEEDTDQSFYWSTLKKAVPIKLPITFNLEQVAYELINKNTGKVITEVTTKPSKGFATTTATEAGKYGVEIGTVSGVEIPFNNLDNTISVRVVSPAKGREVTIRLRDQNGVWIEKSTNTEQDPGNIESLNFEFAQTAIQGKTFDRIAVYFEFQNADEEFLWRNLKLMKSPSDKKRPALPLAMSPKKRAKPSTAGRAIAIAEVNTDMNQAANRTASTEENIDEDFYDLVDFGDVTTSLITEGTNQLVQAVVTTANTGGQYNHGTEIASGSGVTGLSFSSSENKVLTASVSSNAIVYLQMKNTDGDFSVIARGTKEGNATTGLSTFTFDFASPVSGTFSNTAVYDQLFIFFGSTGTFKWDDIDTFRGTDLVVRIVNNVKEELNCDVPEGTVEYEVKLNDINADMGDVVIDLFSTVPSLPWGNITLVSKGSDDTFVQQTTSSDTQPYAKWTIKDFGSGNRDVARLKLRVKLPPKSAPFPNSLNLRAKYDEDDGNTENNEVTAPFQFTVSMVKTANSIEPQPIDNGTTLTWNPQWQFQNTVPATSATTCICENFELIASSSNFSRFSQFTLEGYTLASTSDLNTKRWVMGNFSKGATTPILKLNIVYSPGTNDATDLDLLFQCANSRSRTLRESYTFTSIQSRSVPASYTVKDTGKKGNPLTVAVVSSTDELIDNNLSVYPNPFTGIFKVIYDQGGDASSEVFARVIDLSGRVVMKQRFDLVDLASKQELEIDGTNLPAGPYIIELNNGKGSVSRSRIIKN